MSNTIKKSLLLIFVKNPQKGRVKTRLAQSIGDQEALDVYQKLLRITYGITKPLECDKQVWYSHFIDDNDLWSDGDCEKRLQSGDDLGARMAGAFKQAFTEGYGKVVIIGSDCLELTQEIIDEAFDALDDHEVVIGPSEDGGYYLFGMTSFYADLFAGINWSTPVVYRKTVAGIKNLNLSMHSLPELNDIDTVEDLQASGIEIALP